MFYHVIELLMTYTSLFNGIHYVSIHAIVGLLKVLTLFLTFRSWFIEISHKFFKFKIYEMISTFHRVNDDLPTTSKFFMLMIIVINLFVWYAWRDMYLWIMMMCLYLAISVFGMFD